MPVNRSYRRSHFTHVPNEIVRGKVLSPNAVNLLVLMLSFPHDWQFSLTWLRKNHMRVGKTGMQKAAAELTAAGYMVRTVTHGDDGKLAGYDYDVFDVPHDPAGNPTPADPPAGTTAAVATAADDAPTTNKESTKKDLTKQPVADGDVASESTAEDREALQTFESLRDELVAVWNAKSGNLTKTRVVSPEIEKLMRSALRRHGHEQLGKLFRTGISAVRDDDHWLGRKARKPRRDGKPYGLVNYLRHMEDLVNVALEEEASKPALNVRRGETWYSDVGVIRIEAIDEDAIKPYKGTVIRPITDEYQRGDVAHLDADDLRRKRT